MKIIRELLLKTNGKINSICFGIPDNPAELEKMFLLRREVYKKNGYISAPSDKDEYDENEKSVYFIAKMGDEIIGTVRLILDNPLPTQKDFSFQEPEEIKEISPMRRGELGRLISVPYKKNIYLPRHLVLLFLLVSVAVYSEENGILGGYSFVTTKLYDKIKKLKVPFKVVEEFEQIYPEGGILYPYFNQKNNRILPIFYKTSEIQEFLKGVFDSKSIFEDLGGGKFKLKDNLYNKFLKLLKII